MNTYIRTTRKMAIKDTGIACIIEDGNIFSLSHNVDIIRIMTLINCDIIIIRPCLMKSLFHVTSFLKLVREGDRSQHITWIFFIENHWIFNFFFRKILCWDSAAVRRSMSYIMIFFVIHAVGKEMFISFLGKQDICHAWWQIAFFTC